jgi:potassium-transporting ATPase KdpC subunit
LTDKNRIGTQTKKDWTTHMNLRPLLAVFVSLGLMTGLAYPLTVTAVGQTFFPGQANGSFIEEGDQTVGCALVGQAFTSDKYFWGRPSATGSVPYDATGSCGSNLSVTSPVLAQQVAGRVAMYRAGQKRYGLDEKRLVPVDLVTASGSGLDGDISLAGADYQLKRVAAARGISLDRVSLLVNQHTRGRGFEVLGEPTVNVLMLNLALDKVAVVGPPGGGGK